MHYIPAAISLTLLVPISVIALDIIRRLIRNKWEGKGSPLPPSPTLVPLLRNLLCLDTGELWETYTEWQAAFGNLLYARLLQHEIVILNSQLDAIELLEKRSQIYSDRPFIATVEPFGLGCNFSFRPYDNHWRLCRRIFHQTFRADAALAFRPMQLRRARQMIVNVIDDPDAYAFHYSTFSAAVAMSAVYDYEPSPRNDPMVHIVDGFLQASLPGMTPKKALLLKFLPFLLYIPDWLPGSSFKREAKKSHEWANRMVETPYQYVQKRMGPFVFSPYLFDGIRPHHSYEEIRRIISLRVCDGSQACVYNRFSRYAAVETTSSSLVVFTLAMVQNPHVWKRAQAEIDAVLGMDRLPDFDDRSSLPYVNAVIRETLRWQPVIPLGVPHATSTSDIYKGFYIPKGTTIIPNTWAMSRDEVRYPNAEQFIPERFLTAEGTLIDDDPSEFVFGFGRRLCPGRHTADASLFSAIATVLATLEFSPAKDAKDKDIAFEPKYINGITRHPMTFPCRISPRSHISKASLERVLAR
ncbi:cytochrome P450 [Gyrodon lividus]|nr:cytochrome P450 [Gyrodon lividus]